MVRPPSSVTRSSESAPVRAGERYTEQQLVEILRRASERQEGLVTDADGRFSLEEIKQIASEVGIEPAHVATAAAEVTAGPPPRSGPLGAPTVFRFERWVDGELSRSTIGELIDIARRRTGLQGTVSEALDTIEWRGRGNMDATMVSVGPRQGRTKITIMLTRVDAATVTATTTVLGGIGAAGAIGGSLVPVAAQWGPLATAAAVFVSLGWAGAGTWLATRAIWRRLARKYPRDAAALGTELVEAAQRAEDDARMDSE